MKQEYKTPKVEVIEFDSADVICTSGMPVEQSLFTNGGVQMESKSFSDVNMME